MEKNKAHTQRNRSLAIIAALLTAAIWSSSFVFVKMLLPEIGPFSIAGLRYFLGSVLLLPWVAKEMPALRQISRQGCIRLLLLGISSYVIGNGIFFWALEYIPTTTASFMMGLKPLLVLLAGIFLLKELPTRLQILGIAISLSGSIVFFKDGVTGGDPIGLVIAGVSILGYASFGILGRSLARDYQIGTLLRTAIPLALGGGLMLLGAIPIEGIPHLSPRGWALVLILAVVNTALGYILHNYAIKVLFAFEMDIFLSLAPLGTAVLAWLLLDEVMPAHQILGMFIVIFGVGLVQAASERSQKTEDVVKYSVPEP